MSTKSSRTFHIQTFGCQMNASDSDWLPRPPWFVTNRKGHSLGRLLVAFQYRPSLLKIPRIFLNALRG